MENMPDPRFQLYGQERFHTGMLCSWAVMALGNEANSSFCDFMNGLIGKPGFFETADRLEPLVEYKKVDLCLISTAQSGKGVAIELKVDSNDTRGLTEHYYHLLKDRMNHFVYLTLGDGEFAEGPHPSSQWRRVGLEKFMRFVSVASPQTEPPLSNLLRYWYEAFEQEVERRRRAIDVLVSGKDEQNLGYRNGGTRILALQEIKERVSPRLPNWNSSVYRYGNPPDTILNFRYKTHKPFYAEINRSGRLSLKVNNEQLEASGLSRDELVDLVKTCAGNPEPVKPRQGTHVQIARWNLGLWRSLEDMERVTNRLVMILEDVEDKVAARV
jgi:hypothetical protein